MELQFFTGMRLLPNSVNAWRLLICGISVAVSCGMRGHKNNRKGQWKKVHLTQETAEG